MNVEINKLLQEIIDLKKEVAILKSKLSQETMLRESAEEKYKDMCERCINLFLKEGISIDNIVVEVCAPRFMSRVDFETGVAQAVIALSSVKREEYLITRGVSNEIKP